MKYFLILLSSFLTGTTLSGQTPTIHTYFKDLALDLYTPSVAAADDLVIYVHGGGFSGGNRKEGKDLCTYLQEKGIACASITYTLYMKGRTGDWGCDGILAEKLKTLQLAANEIWAATNFLTGPVSPLDNTPQRVFLAGSSAGAEAVLHAAFYDPEKMKLIDHGLSTGYRYAGVISGAGAIVDAGLITEESKVPLLLFHGTKDPLVPYGTAAHHFCQPDQPGWLMLFGAGALADQSERVGGSYALYTHTDAGHEIAGRYFHGYYEETLRFIQLTNSGASFQLRRYFPKGQ